MTTATQIKVGNVIEVDGELFRVLKIKRITPGKGNAVVQTEIRGVKSGVKTQKRFRSNENVETVAILTRSMQFLYESDGIYHFMDNENFEQYEMSSDLLGEARDFLVTETAYNLEIYESQPIGISLPPRVTVKITKTDPAQKGVAGKTKSAETASGLVIKVPLFVDEGDAVVVNTEKKEYVVRA